MTKIGYVRVSTVEQNEDRQVKALEDAGCEKLFIDKMSGKNTDRPQLKAMLAYVREGDTVIIESISRLARNTVDCINLVMELTGKGVSVISQKESIDTTTPQGEFMLSVFAAMAKLERDQLLQRQAEGIAVAKANGKHLGRPKVEVNKKEFVKQYQLWKEGEQTAVETMKKLDLKRDTFYRMVKQYEADKAQPQ